MVARTPPEAWFWSYDIKPDEIASVLVPGVRLIRLSSYRKGTSPRFAALAFKDGGPARRWTLDLDAAAAVKLAQDAHSSGERPVAITVDVGGPGPRFAVVLEAGAAPATALHADLDEARLRALVDERHRITDLVTYLEDGARKYAAIVEEHAGPSWLFTGVTPHELDARLIELGAALVRARSYLEGGKQRFVAVAEPAPSHPWAWYPALDPDGVARQLETNESYPFDLDATRDEAGLRFSVVMDRDA